MNKYKLLISYDGTNFAGWQIQPNRVTIQQLIQDSLKIIFKEEIALIGASRTDAGVHALCQTAHFSIEKEIDILKTEHSLNGLLPKDIRILKIEKVKDSFHARYDAIKKIYKYYISSSRYQNPFDRLYSYHYCEPLDLNLMKEGSKLFIGKKDFTSFSNEPQRGAVLKNPIRTLYRLDIDKIDEKIIFEIEGDGFLYKMVRNIIGTLLDLSLQKIELSDIEKIFEAKDRKRASRALPSKGLFLVKIFYENEKVEGISKKDLK